MSTSAITGSGLSPKQPRLPLKTVELAQRFYGRDRTQIILASYPSELRRMIDAIVQAVNAPYLRPYEVDSLFYHMAEGIVGASMEQSKSFITWADYAHSASVEDAGYMLLTFGNLGLITIDQSLDDTQQKCFKIIVCKTHDLVVENLIGRIFLAFTRESNSEYDRYFFAHPLFEPLIYWLSTRHNQDGNSHVLEQIASFFEMICMISQTTKGLGKFLLNPSFRIAFAEALVHVLPRNNSRSIYGYIVNTNLVEVVPFLIYEIWGRGLPTLYLTTSPDQFAVAYREIEHLMMYPNQNTTVENFEEIVSTSSRIIPYHYALLCRLWPKWRQSRIDLIVKTV